MRICFVLLPIENGPTFDDQNNNLSSRAVGERIRQG